MTFCRRLSVFIILLSVQVLPGQRVDVAFAAMVSMCDSLKVPDRHLIAFHRCCYSLLTPINIDERSERRCMEAVAKSSGKIP
jgi:hypothetical protein